MRLQLLPLRRGNRQTEPAVDPAGDESRKLEAELRPAVRWSGGSALGTKAWTGVLWLLLLSGPLTAGAVFLGSVLRPESPTSPVAVSAVDSLGDSVAAAELGGQAVRAWLTTRRGQEDSMPVPLPGYAGLARPFQVAELTVAGVRPAGANAWSVTFAARIVNDRKQTTRQYVQVPVRLDASGGSVLALPSVVAAPPLSNAATPKYRQPLSPEGPLGGTVAQFLTAYTTDGGGDVTRYLSPAAGDQIIAVSPPPFSQIEVADLYAAEELTDSEPPTDGQQAHLLVTAVGRTASGQELPLSYALTVQGRDARWEIDQLQLAPNPTTDPSQNTSADENSPAATSESTPAR